MLKKSWILLNKRWSSGFNVTTGTGIMHKKFGLFFGQGFRKKVEYHLVSYHVIATFERPLSLTRGSTPYELFASAACSSAKPSGRKEGCVRVPTRPPQVGTFRPRGARAPCNAPARRAQPQWSVREQRDSGTKTQGEIKTQGKKLDTLPGYSTAWPAPVRTVLAPLGLRRVGKALPRARLAVGNWKAVS